MVRTWPQDFKDLFKPLLGFLYKIGFKKNCSFMLLKNGDTRLSSGSDYIIKMCLEKQL